MAGKCVSLLLLVAGFQLYSCATTTRKPFVNENESFNFLYDPTSHMLGMSNSRNHVRTCYVLALTQDEQNLVHTPDGLTRLELKMFTHLSSASTTMTVDQLTTSSARLGHFCHNAASIYTITV